MTIWTFEQMLQVQNCVRLMASIGWALLLFLVQLCTLTTSRAHGDGNLTLWCHPDQAGALLQLKQSFLYQASTAAILPSWQNGTNCCLWEGVTCDAASGLVTVLNLNGRGLGSQGLEPALFSLKSLQRLDLSMNYLGDYSYNIYWHQKFERLPLLTHLNLSNSGLYGQVPTGISKLVNLVSLDLSSHFVSPDDDVTAVTDSYNTLWEPNFQTLVANLSNLRELYLDQLQIMSSSGEEWGKALAKYVPHLQVLSLRGCGLNSPIHHSLSSLRSLVRIDLGSNDVPAGPIPDFFVDFLNLSALQLSDMNLEGWFPQRFFKLENLRVLDLSFNPNLSGHLPNISHASSLETLRLEGTNFSYAIPTSSSNFNLLRELSLDGKCLSVEFLSSFAVLGSLRQLEITLMNSRKDLASILSWIGDLRNLTSLSLSGCDFSWTMPSSIGNLKALRRLKMFDCNLPRPILSEIGNLIDLQDLEMSGMDGCKLHGSMASSIGNLTNLRSLYIKNCDACGIMPAAIGYLRNLRRLEIYNGDFAGAIPSAVGNLTNLKSMVISESQFSGPIPYAVGQLKELTVLQLEGNSFAGQIPNSIGNLTRLFDLRLSANFLSGEIPISLFTLPMLHYLDLSDNQLSGPIQAFDVASSCLVYVELSRNELTGEIPWSFFKLTTLEFLYIGYNNLIGEIPLSLFTLPMLHYLDLSNNQLSGPIQAFDVASSCLVDVDLTMNELTGEIPWSFFKLTTLEFLYIGYNNLIGLVDLTSFWRLTKLIGLDLSNNNLSVMDGTANNSFSTYPSGLVILRLACCSITKFPSILTRIEDVRYLDLSCNKISGDIPNWVWDRSTSSLMHLNLSHNMFTGMGLNSSVLPLSTTLDVLDLSSNRLQGQIPMPNSSAEFLDYSHNNFSFIHPNFTLYLSSTRYLRMSNNSISGYIPNSVCNSRLDVLDLSYNNFSGPIPSCLVENAGLAVLNLRENHFRGTLPSNITDRCALQTIDLHGNRIEGQLPRALCNCTDLEVLDLGKNQIIDTFPYWLGRLSNLRVLVLRSNHFYGSIVDLVGDHQSRKNFSSLQIVDLSSNNFSENLSSEWFGQLKSMMAKFNSTGHIVHAQNVSAPGRFYQDSIVMTYKGSSVTFERILTTLTAIDFSNNRLEGTIPESVGRLVSLRVLNMSHNAFTGKIPAQLGGMTGLESLDLSCNQLSGEIPQELTNLTFMSTLNLSDNQLVGKIPQSRQFFTFDNSSFEGNAGLCGLPLSNPCGISPAPPGEAHVEKSSHVDVALFLFVGLGFGVGFAAAILMRWGRIGEWYVKYARASRT